MCLFCSFFSCFFFLSRVINRFYRAVLCEPVQPQRIPVAPSVHTVARGRATRGAEAAQRCPPAEAQQRYALADSIPFHRRTTNPTSVPLSRPLARALALPFSPCRFSSSPDGVILPRAAAVVCAASYEDVLLRIPRAAPIVPRLAPGMRCGPH